jgi:hypothetical protein
MHKKMRTDLSSKGVGVVPDFTFQDFSLVDEGAMVAQHSFVDREWKGHADSVWLRVSSISSFAQPRQITPFSGTGENLNQLLFHLR